MVSGEQKPQGHFCRPSTRGNCEWLWADHAMGIRPGLLWFTQGLKGSWVAGCWFAKMYSWPWVSEVSLTRGILACWGCCALGLAEEGNRLASWQHQMFSEETEVFSLDSIIFSFTTDQSCYSGWRRSSYCRPFSAGTVVCARGSRFLPSEPFLSSSRFFHL